MIEREILIQSIDTEWIKAEDPEGQSNISTMQEKRYNLRICGYN